MSVEILLDGQPAGTICLTPESAAEYIARHKPGIREHLSWRPKGEPKVNGNGKPAAQTRTP